MGISKREQERVVRRYVTALNARDIDAIEELLAPDCRFIDSIGCWVEGREDCLEASRRFLAMEPEFRIAIENILMHGGEVLINGTTSAQEPMLCRDTLWRARSDGKQLIEWQSYGEGSTLPLAKVLMGERAYSSVSSGRDQAA
jgi:limonene-1,2-epoxide hydrolase